MLAGVLAIIFHQQLTSFLVRMSRKYMKDQSDYFFDPRAQRFGAIVAGSMSILLGGGLVISSVLGY